jgi:hypothetical protein
MDIKGMVGMSVRQKYLIQHNPSNLASIQTDAQFWNYKESSVGAPRVPDQPGAGSQALARADGITAQLRPFLTTQQAGFSELAVRLLLD